MITPSVSCGRRAQEITGIGWGIMGNPTLQFRHRIGSAGVGKLPSFEQVVGFGVELTIIRGEVQVDPKTQKVRFSVGFTFAR